MSKNIRKTAGLILFLVVAGQLYLSFRLFSRGDKIGGVIYLILALAFSVAMLKVLILNK